MTLFRIPSALPFIFRDLLWKVKEEENVIYLTFDDGPEPSVTPFVLDQLKRFDAKATFFCLGKNVESNQELFREVLEEGHSVGNHTYCHPNGWKSRSKDYIEDVNHCTAVFKSSLFRPPYGKLKWRQYRALRKKFQIVMWDVITHDYKADLDQKKALETIISLTRPGSIVVFHDSLKAEKNLKFLLPAYLKHFQKIGYRFERLKV